MSMMMRADLVGEMARGTVVFCMVAFGEVLGVRDVKKGEGEGDGEGDENGDGDVQVVRK